MSAQNKKTYGVASLAIIALIFVAIVLLSQQLLRGARVDLTRSHQFTLSDGSKSILKTIPEPINLYFFFTQKNTAQYPAYQAYAARVRELLEEMQERAGGKLRLKLIDPQPYSEEEDQAVKYGLTQAPMTTTEKMMFGLAGTNATDGQAAVPFFDPKKEALVEYDIMKMIQSLIKTDKAVIGFVSSLPLSGGMDPQSGQMTPPSAIYQQLGERFELRNLGADVSSIDPEIKVVMLVHPKKVSDDTQYALDQFVLRGGRLIAFVDPLAQSDPGGADPSNPSSEAFASKSSDLPKLFKAWGVGFDQTKVALDRKLGYEVPPTQQASGFKTPVIVFLTQEQVNQNDVATADLQLISLDAPGALSFDAKAMGLNFQSLLNTSTEAQLTAAASVSAVNVAASAALLEKYQAGGKALSVAGALSGMFKSAFPERASATGHLAASKEANVVLLVADTDMVTDRMWVNAQNFGGQMMYNAVADNGDFIVNSVDKMTGDINLISIRSRGKQQTSFTRVDKLRDAAQASFRDQELKLEEELKLTDQRLQELQQAKSVDAQMILSPEQEKALLEFQTKRADVNKQLRELRRGLDKDIEGLGNKIKALGTFLMPLGVIAFAILYLGKRTRRRLVAATKPAQEAVS
jgi:ABC-type uncharacterized transport system involved in gliding motility auxiliary subunit